MQISRHLYFAIFVWIVVKFSPKCITKKLGMIFTILGIRCSFLNWEGADIWPQIRPREVPVLASIGTTKTKELSRTESSPLMGPAIIYCRWKSTVDIESERRCQVDVSTKMIQSRARCRLVCSLPAFCVKLLTATLRTIWVTRQESV